MCITGRKSEALEKAAAELDGADRLLTVAGKAHDPEHQADAVEKVVDRYGRLDILVNNVGTSPVFGPLMDLELGAAAKIFEVNVLSALAWTQVAYRKYLQANGGVVANMASVAGIGISPGIGMYGASKAAVINLTKQLAAELAPTVRVNAVAPAVVKTKFAAALYEEHEHEVAETYPLKRLGVPEDVAGAVAYLVSDDASWVTGQTIVLDGGITLAGT